MPGMRPVNGVVDAFVHVMEQYLTYPTDAAGGCNSARTGSTGAAAFRAAVDAAAAADLHRQPA